jgi:hypothetical protein
MIYFNKRRKNEIEKDIPYLNHVSEMGLRGCVVVRGLFFMLNGPNQLLDRTISTIINHFELF